VLAKMLGIVYATPAGVRFCSSYLEEALRSLKSSDSSPSLALVDSKRSVDGGLRPE
jgi:hypothetical protein